MLVFLSIRYLQSFVQTTVSYTHLDVYKRQDVTIVFDMGNGITWSVNGNSITTDKVSDIDFSVKVGEEAGNNLSLIHI